MLSISRTDRRVDGYVYTCDSCNADAQSVARIDHSTRCPVDSPDTVELPLSDSSLIQVRNILRDMKWLYQRRDTAEDMMDKIHDIAGVRWVDNQSTSRIAVGLGSVSTQGEFHREDQRGIVLKLDPAVRWNKEHTPLNSNLDELMTWETATQSDTTQFFAEILVAARDGAWLLMEECLPICHSVRPKMKNRDVLYDDGGQYTKPFLSRLSENGWVNPDYKNANMGLTDSGQTVLLDYGTGPRRKAAVSQS